MNIEDLTAVRLATRCDDANFTRILGKLGTDLDSVRWPRCDGMEWTERGWVAAQQPPG